ncbi:hypothetical protein OAR97_00310 [Arcobacteraceae bacterium]|nr:hypothetical protein [Arcobacteraceae bacterium]
MEEFTVSKEELHELFQKKTLKDTNKGWYFKDQEVEIIAIHTIETKYIQDMMRADFYKIKPAESYR